MIAFNLSNSALSLANLYRQERILLLEVLSATFVLVIISNSLVVEALQLLEFLQ